MQSTNIIGDTCKDRRIDYALIKRINDQYEIKAKKEELKAKLAKKTETQNPEKETKEPNPIVDIKYIKTPDELTKIKGNYSLQKGLYVIDFEIHVPNGCGLILEPGVEFYFTKDAGITCEGRFEAKGKSGLEVLLTAKDKDKGWKNLYLKGGAEAILDSAGFSYGKGRKDKSGDISGGAIILEIENSLKPSLRINNSYFENNSAKYGGAICNNNGDIRIKENNRFENNSAKYGGAIHDNEGDITIKENNRFENNSAGYNGGAVYNYFGDILIKENNSFENNSAGYNGGAVYNYFGDILIKENNSFENNSAEDNGGAIRSYEGKLDIDKSKNIFKNNKPDDISEA